MRSVRALTLINLATCLSCWATLFSPKSSVSSKSSASPTSSERPSADAVSDAMVSPKALARVRVRRYSRTHALTHSRTHALTHSRTHALTRSRVSRLITRSRGGGDEASMKKAEKANTSMIAVRAKFEMGEVQMCHEFVRGRCLKTVLDDDPLTCREGHDKPKSEFLCCSMHKPGDLLYNKGFTKCRSLSFGIDSLLVSSDSLLVSSDSHFFW